MPKSKGPTPSVSRHGLLTSKLVGKTVAGGVISRERFGRLLGVTALAGRGAEVTAVAWIMDHLAVEVAQPEGEPVVLIIERVQEGRPAFLSFGELSLGYRGPSLHPLLEAAVQRVAPRALGQATLEQVARLVASDPEAGRRGLPLPMRPTETQQRFEEQALLSSWGAPGVWSQFFAIAEISRAQLDSIDFHDESIFIQHCDFECVFVNPQMGVPMVPLALFPWEDRIRHIDWGYRRGRQVPDPASGRLIITDLDESDIILGRGPTKLDAVLTDLGTRGELPATMVFCSSTCVPVVTGEDVDSVILRQAQSLPVPLLHLTTTPHSMQVLLRQLLVTRRLEAERKRVEIQPGTINLIGFAENPAQQELEELLGALGIEINTVLIPALKPARIDRLPLAQLSVLCPNELWQNHYDMLLFDSPTPSIAPVAPFGVQATRRWLAEIAASLECEVDVESVFKRRWEPLQASWEELTAVASRHRLGFVVSADQLELLGNPAKTWGVPLFSSLREMGFRVKLFVYEIASDRELGVDRVRQHLGSEAEHLEIATFNERAGLWNLLGSSELSAVYSEHFYDRRLTEQGISSFCLQHFEPGLTGTIRTLRRLIECCELPFYRRYGSYLSRAAAARPGLVHPMLFEL